MGSGLVEVVLLAALTIIVLPGCFFTLLALLDRFERSLGPDAEMLPVQFVVKPAPVTAAAADLPSLADETAGGEVFSLPIAVTVAEAPAAATG